MAKRPLPESTPRSELFAALQRDCEQMCARVLEATYLMTQTHARGELSTSECVDIGFLSRDASDFLDKSKKELRKLQEQIGVALGRQVMLTFEGDVHAETKLAGRYATGRVDVKVVPLMTSRKDPSYVQGLKELGIPDELIQNEAIELRWSGLIDYVKSRAAEGRSVPTSLRHESTPCVVFVRRRGLD